eukprot:423878-Prymnesium_polylepis.1
MKALFNDSSTRFIGKADRDKVTDGYLDLRAKLKEFDEAHVPLFVRGANDAATSHRTYWKRYRTYAFCGWSFSLLLNIIAFVVVFILPEDRFYSSSGWINPRGKTRSQFLLSFIISAVEWVSLPSLFMLTSPIVRAHLAGIMRCAPHDSFEYTFHWTIHEPPFRTREQPVHSEVPQDDVSIGMIVPAVFRPTKRPSQALHLV